MDLLRNSIITPDGTVLNSKSNHDFVQHKDQNGYTYMIDGGCTDFTRITSDGQHTDNSLYSTDSIEKLRKELKWGSYGKDGGKPLHYIKYSEMTTKHIENIIKSQFHNKYVKVLIRELEYRNAHNMHLVGYNVKAKGYVHEFYFLDDMFNARSREQAIYKAFKHWKLPEYKTYFEFKKDMSCKKLR